jgi:16S rRNA (cytidine1402-2'-O)-methyltransferase
MPGTLFVVATPIGNLEDISMRALRVLREVDLVAAEDTRRTAKLLSHYEIHVPMVSLHEHNERREAPRLLARLTAGESIALVSDAGTPTISDPGRDLVKAARQQGLPVVPVPGPSAVTTALAGSGFPADRFLFMGFPPRSGSAREEWLETLAAEPGAVVCFEAPTRIHQTLKDIARSVGKRPILTCRELTKLHEVLVEYSIDAAIPARGEFTVVVSPQAAETDSAQLDPEPGLVSKLVEGLIEGAPTDRQSAEAMVARAFQVKASRLKNIIKKHAISVKRQRQ